jgi:hypothetical protein
MGLVVDAHLHIYPTYQLDAGLDRLILNLSRWAPGARMAAILTERAECRFFKEASQGAAQKTAHWKIVPDAGGLTVFSNKALPLRILPGHQIATSERIEVLSLLTYARPIEDGHPARDVIKAILAAGGLPALAWAPGKWLFGRGRLVGRLLEAFGRQVFVCDSPLRPLGMAEPPLFQLARHMGCRILAGSDPLPFHGEEQWMGAYASRIEGVADGLVTPEMVRHALTAPETRVMTVGCRASPGKVFYRLVKNALVRHASL